MREPFSKVRFRRTRYGTTYFVVDYTVAKRFLQDETKIERSRRALHARFGFRNLTGPYYSHVRGSRSKEWRFYVS